MSCPCHCYNPEDAFVADAATESVDSCADLPPLVPAVEVPRAWPKEPWAVDFFAGTHLSRSTRGGGTEVIQPPLVPASGPVPPPPAVAPQPLFSAWDTKDFIDLYKTKKRDLMTKKYQHHIDDAIDDLLALCGDALKEEMRGAIERADGIEKLYVKLYSYTKAKPTVQHHGSYTDVTGNWWTSLEGCCASITTTLGGVDVDFLVRETHFLSQLAARIGDPQHFIISKRVGVPVDYGSCRLITLTLWLEFWPKGVTAERRIKCSNP